jgi:hypothetical protein
MTLGIELLLAADVRVAAADTRFTPSPTVPRRSESGRCWHRRIWRAPAAMLRPSTAATPDSGVVS